MSFSLKRSLKQLFGRKAQSTACRRLNAPAFRLESLEDRTVPSTVVLNSFHSNSTYYLPSNTTLDEQIVVPANISNLTIVGNNTTLAPTSAPTGSLMLAGQNAGASVIDIYGKNIKVTGVTVNGASAPSSVYTGIRVVEGGSATISNNTVENIANAPAPYDIGIDVGIGQLNTTITPAQGGAGTAKVLNNVIKGYSGAGVLVDGSASAALVQGNTITGLGGSSAGTLVEYGVQVSNNSTARIQCNTISANTVYGSAGAPNNPVPTSAGIFFLNDVGRNSVAAANTLTGNDDGVLVETSNSTCSAAIQVVNNTIESNYGYAGVFVLSSNNVQVFCNIIANNLTYNGVAIYTSSNVTVSSNDITSNGTPSSGTDGIFDYQGNGNQILANNSYSNSGNGINLLSTQNDSLFNNYTWSNTLDGIQDTAGTNNAIWLGSSDVNLMNGILLSGTTCDTIVGNVIDHNAMYGIYLQGAKNTFIAFDFISGNGAGSVYIDSASTGTTMIANWTSSPPVKDGSSGACGSSNALSNAVSDADSIVSGLCS
jgi:parallel beta-helix repeat protein